MPRKDEAQACLNQYALALASTLPRIIERRLSRPFTRRKRRDLDKGGTPQDGQERSATAKQGKLAVVARQPIPERATAR
jgi:hypothetical protein